MKQMEKQELNGNENIIKGDKFANFKLHREIKSKLDSYDWKYESKLDDGIYIKSGGLIIFNEADKRPYFGKYDKVFSSRTKWTIQDYVDYFILLTQRIRTIEGVRPHSNTTVRLTKSNITLTELEWLEKVSKTIFKIENIIRDAFEHSKITYKDVVIPEGFYIPSEGLFSY